MKRILIVDDDPQATDALSHYLHSRGFIVEQVNDSTRALITARLFAPDVVILDFLMPGMHGGEVAWQLAGDAWLAKTPEVLVLSGLPTAEFEIKLPPIKVTLLEKPVDLAHLLALLGRETAPAENAHAASQSY